MAKRKITIERLNKLFAGKMVKITHTGNPRLRNQKCRCKAFHAMATESGVTIEAMNGSRWDLIPDKLTNDAVEGNVANYITGRRKVQLVELSNLVFI